MVRKQQRAQDPRLSRTRGNAPASSSPVPHIQRELPTFANASTSAPRARNHRRPGVRKTRIAVLAPTVTMKANLPNHCRCQSQHTLWSFANFLIFLASTAMQHAKVVQAAKALPRHLPQLAKKAGKHSPQVDLRSDTWRKSEQKTKTRREAVAAISGGDSGSNRSRVCALLAKQILQTQR